MGDGVVGTAVDDDLVTALDQALPDLLDRSLEPAVPRRYTSGSHHSDTHVTTSTV